MLSKKWKYLIKKYPERAGVAYEMYLRDPNKDETNPVTYFNFAKKRMNEIEARNKKRLKKYISKNPPDLDL
jgi:hypothetical protein